MIQVSILNKLLSKFPTINIATPSLLIKYITFTFLIFIIPMQAKAAVIWEENFDDPAIDQKGATSGTTDMGGITKWSIDTSSANLSNNDDWFRVETQAFEGHDLDGEAIWESENINISGYQNVTFQLDAVEVGDLEGNGSGINTDYFDIYYSINNGAFNLIPNWNSHGDANHTLLGDHPDDNDWISTTINQMIPDGSLTLKIRIIMRNSAGTEFMRLDNVIVNGDSTPIAVPSLSEWMLLLLILLLGLIGHRQSTARISTLKWHNRVGHFKR